MLDFVVGVRSMGICMVWHSRNFLMMHLLGNDRLVMDFLGIHSGSGVRKGTVVTIGIAIVTMSTIGSAVVAMSTIGTAVVAMSTVGGSVSVVSMSNSTNVVSTNKNIFVLCITLQ